MEVYKVLINFQRLTPLLVAGLPLIETSDSVTVRGRSSVGSAGGCVVTVVVCLQLESETPFFFFPTVVEEQDSVVFRFISTTGEVRRLDLVMQVGFRLMLCLILGTGGVG